MSRGKWHGHGWRMRTKGDEPITVYVGRLPSRESVAIYYTEGGTMDVIAYCRSEEHARKMLEILDVMAGEKP